MSRVWRMTLDDQDRLIYFWELRSRIEYAQRAWAGAEHALSGGAVDAFWYSVDSFLSSSIAVANILWPSSQHSIRGPIARARAGDLRGELGLSADAPAGLREVRNGFEHFDERIDEWRTTSKRKNFVDTNIAPAGAISGVDPGDIARNYDPDLRILSVYGKSMAVDPILHELESVMRALPPRY